MKKLCMFCFLFFHFSLWASPTHIKLVDRITSKFANKLQKEKNMFLFGYGGRMMNHVKEIEMSYHVIQNCSIEDARKLFVEVAESYLTCINADVQLRPHLENYPFTIDNLSLGIGFEDDKRNFQSELAYITYCQRTGHIVYSAHDPDRDILYTIYEEPYREALELVKKTQE